VVNGGAKGIGKEVEGKKIFLGSSRGRKGWKIR